MLSRSLQKNFVRGMNQQFWFWGIDTCDRTNNLLEEYGFRRFKTRFVGGSSRYRKKWNGRTLELHSFCAGIYGGKKDGFIYIRKCDEGYVWLGDKPPLPNRYSSKRMLSFKNDPVRFHAAAADFLGWMDEFENWVDENYGKNYRKRCFRDYHLKWFAPKQAREWFRLYRSSPELLGSLKMKFKFSFAL